jgi:hypothetical protein
MINQIQITIPPTTRILRIELRPQSVGCAYVLWIYSHTTGLSGECIIMHPCGKVERCEILESGEERITVIKE